MITIVYGTVVTVTIVLRHMARVSFKLSKVGEGELEESGF